MLRNARAKRASDFVIRVAVREARLLGDAALIVYDEHQESAGVKTARRSSALFTADPDAPEGVVWRHLQETWLSEE
jgi:hypothetical protein